MLLHRRRCAVYFCRNPIFRAGYCVQHHSIYRMWSDRGPWSLQSVKKISAKCGFRHSNFLDDRIQPVWELLNRGKLGVYSCPRCFAAVVKKSLEAIEVSRCPEHGLPFDKRQEQFLALLKYMWSNRAIWAVSQKFYALRPSIMQKISYARSVVVPRSLVHTVFPVVCCRWCLNLPISRNLCHYHSFVVGILSHKKLPLDVLEFSLCPFVHVQHVSSNYVHVF